MIDMNIAPIDCRDDLLFDPLSEEIYSIPINSLVDDDFKFLSRPLYLRLPKLWVDIQFVFK